ncbi:MAG: limonene-1,2-epoxide hydrolase family protein [Reyranella sp.]|uniref:limonene-1,2-epoxide hydrolase family protein n=1 Tax=Reyranella sp. TaxID=1929291 RepID=UPI00272FFB2F|nr:limonene-1,2-epoxide hydrolase family protein [Reyranella sp.]MDP1963089.1 limonene-1,2-epoxide hydrolase family protein [Reyranella sp.]MDP2378769.1 limonene-1,2-epoxide hydrolase family protein [Reyranella sp.]
MKADATGITSSIAGSRSSLRGNLRRFIGGFVKDWTRTTWDILNIIAHGNIVMAERLDRTRVGGKGVDLPCCGVFELEDGKIHMWRDYFDLATYTRALAANP